MIIRLYKEGNTYYAFDEVSGKPVVIGERDYKQKIIDTAIDMADIIIVDSTFKRNKK